MSSFLLARRVLVGVSMVTLALGGCGGKNAPAPPTPADSKPKPQKEKSSRSESASRPKNPAKKGGPTEPADFEVEQLREVLAERSAEVFALEETVATLELELRSALEELVRSRANVRSVQSRAFAVSRIAEVRVELNGLSERDDPALADRLQRAGGFLDHADRALAEDNVGVAAYLAERAGELLRQVRTIAEMRGSSPTALIPLVPPRTLRVLSQANLRKAPSSDADRVGAVTPGTELTATARRGEWFQVDFQGMAEVWIHRRLVR
ncbi:MAG TPA: SH3 domain-containing protein [Vicinamibacteria bacterium]